MKHSVEEVKVWAERQKRLYAKGLLTAKQVADLKSIPGWTWTVSGSVSSSEGGSDK
jgi:hypothetical protein